LAVYVEHHPAQVLLVNAVFEGEDEADGLCEVALQHDLAEELHLFAVAAERDLNLERSTPVSR
jgi:hypothetical protein